MLGSLYDVWTNSVLILQISLSITALLGFGLYLWYLKSSDDQSQSRLLNILNGYLSVTCIGFSLTLFANYALQLTQTRQGTLIALQISAVHIIAISSIFLLISFATILNHFKPGLTLTFLYPGVTKFLFLHSSLHSSSQNKPFISFAEKSFLIV